MINAQQKIMTFHVSLFNNSEIVSITRYGPNDAGQAGTVMQAVFLLSGQLFMCIDSPVKYEFTFTPALSLYVKCDSEQEVDGLYEKLGQGGQVLLVKNSAGGWTSMVSLGS